MIKTMNNNLLIIMMMMIIMEALLLFKIHYIHRSRYNEGNLKLNRMNSQH